MGPNGPVGLNMLAIEQGMKDYNIDKDEKIDFSYTVRRIANIIFSLQADKMAREMKMNK
jgi:hypothetical protein